MQIKTHSSGVYFAFFSRFFFSDLFVSVFWQAEPYHCTLRKRKRSVLEKYISHDHWRNIFHMIIVILTNVVVLLIINFILVIFQ